METAATPPPDSENQATEVRQTRPTVQLDLRSAFACFLLPLTFRLAEFFVVLYVRAKHCQLTYQLRSFLRREPVADDRNADLTLNRSAHHTCALDDTTHSFTSEPSLKPGMWEAVRNNFTGVFIAYGHNIANIVFTGKFLLITMLGWYWKMPHSEVH